MELDAREVHRILVAKGVQHFTHVNTVKTSCSFLRSGKLLSRGTIDELGLPQTDQQSDSIDQEHGLWYDVFVDTVDIHHRARRRNNYGPVLFEMSLDILLESWLPYVWVTKSNPANWQNGMPSGEKYYQFIQEFEQAFQFGNFDKLFVLRSIGGVLRLQPYLRRIVLDSTTQLVGNVKAYDQAVGALKSSAIAGGLNNLTVDTHVCQQNCICLDQYSAMTGAVFEKFYAP